ncbi:Bestrophin RFP-TM chloride channel family protein, partial [Brugia pahangi]
EVDKFRHSLQLLCNYDWVPIPLVYSQVVFLAVYVHFLICLISQQFIITDNSHTTYLDLIVPMMTVIQFVFFIGWLKVAQALLNPFGDDDDDFECNYLIDKNLTQSFCIADNYDRVPDIRPDLFWRSQKVLPTSGNTLLNGSTVDFKTTKHNRPTQTANPEKTMQKITWNHYDHFEEQINRSSIQLKQYSKSNTDYYVLPNPNKNNKMKITRL